jgi:hypothetical protein
LLIFKAADNRSVAATLKASSLRGWHAPRHLAFWAILTLIVICAAEVGSAVVVRLLLQSSVRQMFWSPDLDAARAAWEANAAAVDYELGWLSETVATSWPRDASGAKNNLDYPEPGEACGSAYGDSFIWGDEVPLADGWIEQLSRRLGCRVSNYGVSAYGTDQAYLRFHRADNDRAPIALLGIFPENIVRNVNQYRGFMGYAPEPFLVKGRFVLNDAGHLEWIARPRLEADGFLNMHTTPSLFLQHEYLLPDSRDGPIVVRFPYIIKLARFALAPRVRERMSGRTPWDEFFHPNHPSRALELTIAIVAAFVSEAEQRGKHPFIVMQPSGGSFRTGARFGRPDYATFVDEMANRGIGVFDPAPALIAALNGRSYCELYTKPSVCQGHFSVTGGGLVAEVVASELRRAGFVKDPAANN